MIGCACQGDSVDESYVSCKLTTFWLAVDSIKISLGEMGKFDEGLNS